MEDIKLKVLPIIYDHQKEDRKLREQARALFLEKQSKESIDNDELQVCFKNVKI